jgi:DMSO reductase family type II enzyme heme b subunit
VDIYPDQVMAVVDTWAYAGAIGVDNPVARPDVSPVLDMVAKGYGSTTVKGMQHANGRGVWRDGIWRVAITRPLEPMGTWDPDLVPPTETALAFAVWDGSANEVGARKAWSRARATSGGTSSRRARSGSNRPRKTGRAVTFDPFQE